MTSKKVIKKEIKYKFKLIDIPLVLMIPIICRDLKSGYYLAATFGAIILYTGIKQRIMELEGEE